MDVAQQRPGGEVGGGARLVPQRAPQHERHVGASRSEERAREGLAPGRAADDRASLLREAADLVLGHGPERDARVLDGARRVVRAPAEQQQLDPDALVQRAEGSDAIGRDVVRHDEDRPAHRSASS